MALPEGVMRTPASARQPPVAKLIRETSEVHGELRVDDYRWLRNREDPDVRVYLEAENVYTEAVMKPTEGFQQALYAEMVARIQETDQDVPCRRGGFFYYSRTEQGQQHAIHCRKTGALDAEEEVTLDLNRLAVGKPFMSLGVYEVSDEDASLLAYSTDETGFRQYMLFVKDLRTGELVEKVAERVGSAAWAADGRTLFYTVEEESTKRQYRLYRHRLGENAHDLVYEEEDPAFNVGLFRTRSRQYLVLGIASLTTSEARFLAAADPLGEWRLLASRLHEQEYDLDHHGDFFYLRVNDTGRNFRLVKASVARPGRESWVEVRPHRGDVMLEGVDCFRDHLVLLEREGGLPQVAVVDLRSGAEHRLAFPEAAYSAWPEANPEFDTRTFRYSYQSLVTPPSIFDYDMETRATTLLKEQPVLGGYDRTRYETERVCATAPDGVGVPLSIVYRKGLVRDGSAPILLSAYGAYGLPLPITFSSNRVSLLDRGVVVALAHVRGGGEMGKRWHDDGRMTKKKNTFTDFIAAAEFLLSGRYGGRDRLVIEGGSAGGLLMGSVMNMRPDLFRAVVLKVPFVDVVNTMLDETLPLTVAEFEEWGNPKERSAYDNVRSYCPYSNLERKAYPAALVKTSFHDSQVMYWEPAKYVAKLRTLKTDTHPLLLKTNMAAGHGGASGRYDHLREVAFDYAFILTEMGVRASP
jgi:oligopeptidase B